MSSRVATIEKEAQLYLEEVGLEEARKNHELYLEQWKQLKVEGVKPNEATVGLWKKWEGEYQNAVIREIGKCEFRELVYVVERLYIRDKDTSAVIRFKLNKGQLKLLRKVWGQAHAGQPMRIKNLKARQIGFSTLSEALIYLFSRAFPGTVGMVLAHKEMASYTLFRMYELFWQKDIFRRDRNYAKGRLRYKECGGEVIVTSAASPEPGRAPKVNWVHLSEFAFFPSDSEQTMLGLMQSVPMTPLSLVIIESTANGAGGDFYDRWKAGEKTKEDWEDDGWANVFVGWHEFEKYRKNFTGTKQRRHFEESLTENERFMIKEYGITLEQLHWRRVIIRDNCKGNELDFCQEYPMTPDEAFMATGASVIPGRTRQEILKRYEALVESKNVWCGNLILNISNTSNRKEYHGTLVKDREGLFTIFEHPKKGHIYAVSADVAECVESQGTADFNLEYKGDRSVIVVFDYGEYEIKNGDICQVVGWTGQHAPPHQVAVWRGYVDPKTFAYYIHYIATFYNQGNVAIEANTFGFSTIDTLRTTLRYPKRRFMRSMEYAKDNSAYGNVKRYGWYTSNQTKGVLVSDMRSAIMFDEVFVFSPTLVDEFSTFVAKKDRMKSDGTKIKTAAALPGKHDDEIMATAIGIQALRRMKKGMYEAEHKEEYTADQCYMRDKFLRKLKYGQSAHGFTRTRAM